MGQTKDRTESVPIEENQQSQATQWVHRTAESVALIRCDGKKAVVFTTYQPFVMVNRPIGASPGLPRRRYLRLHKDCGHVNDWLIQLPQGANKKASLLNSIYRSHGTGVYKNFLGEGIGCQQGLNNERRRLKDCIMVKLNHEREYDFPEERRLFEYYKDCIVEDFDRRK